MILPVHSDKMKFACLKWFVFPFILFVEDKILGVKMNVQNGLKICCDSEKELIDKNAFEGGDVVLLVEHQHSLFVVNRIHRAE